MPVLCEDHNVPYVFVTSKEKLGEASSTKRPTSVTMVVFGGKNKDTKAAADYKDIYDECYAEAKKLVKIIMLFSTASFTNTICFIGRKPRLLNYWCSFSLYIFHYSPHVLNPIINICLNKFVL